MKILAIRGRNLASLARTFEVDLVHGPLGGVGLFAITGPVGAGKSTLLDALCLALFDCTPRLSGRGGVFVGDEGEAAGDWLRSTDPRTLLRRDAAEGHAEVDFTGRDGVRYRARWAVRRARRRPDGRVQDQEMSLVDIDRNVLVAGGRKTEVLAAIEARLGLDFRQFCRSVLLAQGEFAAFLHASADERARLLENLTGADIYRKLSRAAHERRRQGEVHVQVLRAQLDAQAPLHQQARAALEQVAQQLAHDSEICKVGIDIASRYVTWHDAAEQHRQRESEATVALQQGLAADGAAAPRRERLARLQRALPVAARWEVATQQRETSVSARTEATAAAGERTQSTTKHAAVSTALAADLRTSFGAELGGAPAVPPLVRDLPQWQPLLQQWQSAEQRATQLAACLPKSLADVDAAARALAAAQAALTRVEQERERTAAAVSVAQQATQAAELVALPEQRAELQARRMMVVQLREVVAAWQQTVAQSQAAAARVAMLAAAGERLAVAAVEAEQLREAAAVHLATMRRAQAERRAHHDLAAWRAELVEGAPCPLCGATEHPAAGPAQAVDVASVADLAALEHGGDGAALERGGALDLAERSADLAAAECGNDVAAAERGNDLAAAERSADLAAAERGNDLAAAERGNDEAQHLAAAAGAERRGNERELVGARRAVEVAVQAHEAASAAFRRQGNGDAEWLASGDAESAQSLVARRASAIDAAERVLQQHETKAAAAARTFHAAVKAAAAAELGCRTNQARVAVEDQQNRAAVARAETARSDGERLLTAIADLQSALGAACEGLPGGAQAVLRLGVERGAVLQRLHRQHKDQVTAATAVARAAERCASADIAERRALADEAKADAALAKALAIARVSGDDVAAAVQLGIDALAAEGGLLQALADEVTARRAVLQERVGQRRKHEGHDRPELDAADAALALEQARLASQEVERRRVDVQSQLKADDAVRRQRAELQPRLVDAEQTLAVWRALDDLIGSSGGDAFVVFAQSLTLDLLLTEANRRLAELARRYRLQKNPGGEMDFVVVDLDLGGTRRGLQSLSGGETFLVSLALALALATLAAPRSRVETLFLDEGFGTLDAQNLEAALSALDTLQATGCQVGVISHVEGVAERIGAVVEVQPEGGGQSRVRVRLG